MLLQFAVSACSSKMLAVGVISSVPKSSLVNGVWRSRFASARSKEASQLRVLPKEVTLAVTQQALAFGGVLAVENLFALFKLASDNPGRPRISSLAIALAGYGVTIGLMQVENEALQVTALLTGIAASVYVVVSSVNRVAVTKGDASDWPGPKTWPVLMSLGASSVALAFIQSFSQLS